MDELKGGDHLVEALRILAATDALQVEATFVGDGPERAAWERKARRFAERNPQLRVEFTGWLSRDRLNAFLESADVAVVPSLWPEPFGRIGPEAAMAGVPVVAFDVGGIAEWLQDGVNGLLIPGPPTASGLAEVLRRLTREPALFGRLAEGALRSRSRFELAAHAELLVPLLREVAG
jgi:glycosyltransferase involved in cell wall biosynthesis